MTQIEVKLNPDVTPTGSDLSVVNAKSSFHQRIRESASRGYYVTLCGRAFGPKGQLKVKKARNQHCPTFSTNWGGVVYSLPVHKLAAYQWFGEKSLTKGTHVRHLDANTNNFKITNLRLGTASENEMDKPKEVRTRSAKAARSSQGFTPKNAKLDENAVRHIRQVYDSNCGKKLPNGAVKELSARYGVSKTVLHKVKKREYYPNVKD